MCLSYSDTGLILVLFILFSLLQTKMGWWLAPVPLSLNISSKNRMRSERFRFVMQWASNFFFKRCLASSLSGFSRHIDCVIAIKICSLLCVSHNVSCYSSLNTCMETEVRLTFASLLTEGLAGNSTSRAFRIVFSCKMAAWLRLWPNGFRP